MEPNMLEITWYGNLSIEMIGRQETNEMLAITIQEFSPCSNTCGG
jgi:hypothetical protein